MAPAREVSPSPDPSRSAMALNATAIKASMQPQGGSTPGLTRVKSDPDHNSSATEGEISDTHVTCMLYK